MFFLESKIMKPVRFYHVETRRGDGHIQCNTFAEVCKLIPSEYAFDCSAPNAIGDVTVTVPAWQKARAEYSKLKAEFCEKFGSE